MDGCRKYEDLLVRHLDGETLRQDLEALEKHLSECPDCMRLYGRVSDVDRLLRDLPGKQLDPPPYLHPRIMANLPERRESAWRWIRAGGPVAAATAVAGIVALAVVLQWSGAPRFDRVASAPPSAAHPAVPSHPKEGVAVPPPAEAKKPPVLKSAPETGPKTETRLASVPKVQVVKEVKIFFYCPPAQNVAVTGDFNGWDPKGVPLVAAGKPGLWTTDLRLPPGAYSYNFIVDGDLLVPDPNSPNQMPDGYGGTNSILLVQGDRAI